MQVIEEPFDEGGEQDTSGYDSYYYYSGIVYRFLFPGRELHARRFDDSPGEAHFLSFSTAPGGERRFFEAIPYDDSEFQEAALYLRDGVGADRVKILLPAGYYTVDFRRLPGWSASADQGELFHCFQCRAAIPEGREQCPNCGWTWQSE